VLPHRGKRVVHRDAAYDQADDPPDYRNAVIREQLDFMHVTPACELRHTFPKIVVRCADNVIGVGRGRWGLLLKVFIPVTANARRRSRNSTDLVVRSIPITGLAWWVRQGLSDLDKVCVNAMLLSMKHGFSAARALRILTIMTLSVALVGRTERAQEQAPQVPSVTAIQGPHSAQSAAEILTPTNGVDFSGYIGQTMATVKKNWIAAMPAAFYAGAKGKTTLEFQIQSDGRIENISLEASSGTDSLDQAAIKGVRDSSPLEHLPSGFTGSSISLRLSLSYNLGSNGTALGSAFDCNAAASDATHPPPFNRLELLAFLPGGLSPRYAEHVICERGIDFTPDSAFLSTLRYYGVTPDFVDSLAKITPKAIVQPAADRVSAYGLLDVALTDKSHGQLQQAQDEFGRVIKLAPDSATLHLAYARILYANRNYSESEVQARRSLELWPEDADAHVALATALSAQKRDSEAVPEAREALRIFPGHKAARIELGMSLARSGQYKEAIPVLRDVLPMAPQLPVIYKHLAGSLVHAGGDFDEAIQELHLYLKTKPDDAEAHYFLGVALRGVYKPDAALAEFREAARLEPNNSLYTVNAVSKDSKETTSDTSKPDAAQPDDGYVSENVYTNTFFGFSYQFPRGWNVLTAEQGKAMIRLGTSFLANGDPTAQDVAEAAANNWHQLLFVTKETTKGISTNTHAIQIEATSTQIAPQLKTGAEFLQATGAYLLRSGKVSSAPRPPEQVEVAGRSFWKVRLDMQVNNVMVHQIDAVTIEKGYFILLVFASPDASTLDDITATINSLRFTPPPR
jgi:TonB family protein